MMGSPRTRIGYAVQSDLWQTILAAAIRVGTGVTSYLLYAAIARACGPNEFGAFGVLFSAAMMLGVAGSFGQQMFLIREVTQAKAAAQIDRMSSAIVFSTIVVSVGALASGLAFFVAVPAFYDIWHFPVLLTGAALCMLFALSQGTMGMLRVESRALFAMATRDLAWRVASLIAVVAAAAIVGIGQVDALGSLLAVTLALLPILLAHIVIALPKLTAAFSARNRFIPWRQWLSTSVGLAIGAMISSADLYAYTIALGAILPPAETGAFFAGMKAVEFLNLFLMSVTLIIAPDLARLVGEGDPVGIQRKCNSAIAIQSTPAILGAMVVILAAPMLMWLFDPGYVDSANLLRLLAIGMLINALTGATGLMMQLAGMQWLQVAVQGGTLVLSVLALPLLVPVLGVYGAALAYVLQKLVWNAFAIAMLRRKLGVDPSLLGIFDSRTGGLGGLKADIRQQLKWPQR